MISWHFSRLETTTQPVVKRVQPSYTYDVEMPRYAINVSKVYLIRCFVRSVSPLFLYVMNTLVLHASDQVSCVRILPEGFGASNVEQATDFDGLNER
jgi:hypothetical protein